MNYCIADVAKHLSKTERNAQSLFLREPNAPAPYGVDYDVFLVDKILVPLLLEDIETLSKVRISPIKQNNDDENWDYYIAYVLSLAVQGRGCPRACLAIQRLKEHPRKYVRVGVWLGLAYLGVVPVPEIDILLDVINEGLFKYIPLLMYQRILRNLEPIFQKDVALRDALSKEFHKIYRDWSLRHFETAIFLAKLGVLSERVVVTLLHHSKGSHLERSGSEYGPDYVAQRSRNALADLVCQYPISDIIDLPDDLAVLIMNELSYLKPVTLDVQAKVLCLLRQSAGQRNNELYFKTIDCVAIWGYADENTRRALQEVKKLLWREKVASRAESLYNELFPERIEVTTNSDSP